MYKECWAVVAKMAWGNPPPPSLFYATPGLMS